MGYAAIIRRRRIWIGRSHRGCGPYVVNDVCERGAARLPKAVALPIVHYRRRSVGVRYSIPYYHAVAERMTGQCSVNNHIIPGDCISSHKRHDRARLKTPQGSWRCVVRRSLWGRRRRVAGRRVVANPFAGFRRVSRRDIWDRVSVIVARPRVGVPKPRRSRKPDIVARVETAGGAVAGIDAYSAVRILAVDRIIGDIGVEIDLIFVADRIGLQEPGTCGRRHYGCKHRAEVNKIVPPRRSSARSWNDHYMKTN